MLKSGGNVKVMCRVRPFNQKEIAMGVETNMVFSPSGQTLKINTAAESNSNATNHEFNFDHVFNQTNTQKDIYDMAAKPIIDSVLEGFNGTIFAYG